LDQPKARHAKVLHQPAAALYSNARRNAQMRDLQRASGFRPVRVEYSLGVAVQRSGWKLGQPGGLARPTVWLSDPISGFGTKRICRGDL